MDENKTEKQRHITITTRILLVTMLVILVFTVFSAPVSAADLHVGLSQTYSTIQAAINAASPYDTIIVHDGTYNENVEVDKSHLTIHSHNGSSFTTVSASLNPDDHVFNITDQTNVTLEGFEIRDANGTSQGVAGIYMDNASDCNISDNIVMNISATGWNNAFGILLWDSSNNTFSFGSISDINAPIWWDFYSGSDSHGNSAENITISSYPTTISFTYDNGIAIKSEETPPAGGATAAFLIPALGNSRI